MSGQIVVVICAALTFVSLAAADYDTYIKLGKHARQMQGWKKKTKTLLNSLETLSKTLLNDIQEVNQTLQNGFQEADIHIHGMQKMSTIIMERVEELQANNTLAEPEEYVAPLAFQAFVKSSGSQPLVISYVPFKYVDVKLNDGSHFSASGGLFTAPITGLYWFHATFTCEQNGCESVMKKKPVSGGFETIAYMNYYINQETACTTIVLLHPGETVGVYPMTSTFETWDLKGGSHNTFAGYLVATYDDPNFEVPTNGSTAAIATTSAAAAGNTSTINTSAGPDTTQ